MEGRLSKEEYDMFIGAPWVNRGLQVTTPSAPDRYSKKYIAKDVQAEHGGARRHQMMWRLFRHGDHAQPQVQEAVREDLRRGDRGHEFELDCGCATAACLLVSIGQLAKSAGG